MNERATTILLLASLLASSPAPLEAAKETREKVFGEMQPDKALVYVIRKGRFAGSARTLFVYADDELVGVLDNGSYTFAHLEPGSHLIWTNWTKIRKEVDLIPGREYYVEVWGEIEIRGEAEGQRLLEKVKSYATPAPKEIRKAEAHLLKRYPKALRREAKQEKAAIEVVEAVDRPAKSQGYVELPAYTQIRLELIENVTSFHTPTGESVWLRVVDDLTIDAAVAIRAGTVVMATVRHSDTASMGGAGGKLDLVVAAVDAVDGSRVPVLGHLDTAGRKDTAQAVAVATTTAVATALATGGLGFIAVAFAKGKEAFLLAGQRFGVWTREAHWLRPGETVLEAHEEALTGSSWAAKSGGEVGFSPGRRRRPDDVLVLLEADTRPLDVAVLSVGGQVLPEPVRPARVEFSDGKQTLVFDGWSILRYCRFTDKEIGVYIELAGTSSDGEEFFSTVEIPVRLRLKGVLENR